MFSFIMPKKVALSGVCLVLFYYKTLAFFSKIRKLNVTKRSQKSLVSSVIFLFFYVLPLYTLLRIRCIEGKHEKRIMKPPKGSEYLAKQSLFSSCILIFIFVLINFCWLKRRKNGMKQRAIQREQVDKQTKIKCDKLYCLSHFITQMFAFIAINTFL